MKRIFATLWLIGLALAGGVSGHGALTFDKRTGGSNEWRCIYSDHDGAWLWVTDLAGGGNEIACAGPSASACYWFECGCSRLISDTTLTGKICPCCPGARDTGWCGSGRRSFVDHPNGIPSPSCRNCSVCQNENHAFITQTTTRVATITASAVTVTKTATITRTETETETETADTITTSETDVPEPTENPTDDTTSTDDPLTPTDTDPTGTETGAPLMLL